MCGKIGTQSLGGGEYFVTFVDDHTQHVWVYILKHKGEVLQRFQEWKALVEKSSERSRLFDLTMEASIPLLNSPRT